MNKEKLISLSIFSLALSIVISSLIIANSMKNHKIKESPNVALRSTSSDLPIMKTNESLPLIMTAQQVAELFHLSDSMFIGYINAKKIDIPYIKIGEEYYFGRDALLKWANEKHDITIKVP